MGLFDLFFKKRPKCDVTIYIDLIEPQYYNERSATKLIKPFIKEYLLKYDIPLVNFVIKLQELDEFDDKSKETVNVDFVFFDTDLILLKQEECEKEVLEEIKKLLGYSFPNLKINIRNACEVITDSIPKQTKNYEYLLTRNGVCITKIFANQETVVIPDKIAGRKVTGLGRIESPIIEKLTPKEQIKRLLPNKGPENEKIKKLFLPEGLLFIGDYAFDNCPEVKEIYIPSSVYKIVPRALGNKIEKICVENGNLFYKSLDGNLYDYEIKKIYRYAINKKDSIFVLPKTVKEIGVYAFGFVKHLKMVKISEGLEVIGKEAFYTSDIEEIILPNSLKFINDSAFDCCFSLRKLVFPKSLVRLGKSVFSNCHSLSEIDVTNTIMDVTSFQFSHCQSLKEIILPSSITLIGYGMFTGCTLLNKINIPENVTEIQDYAFEECKNLEEVIIPKGVTKIGIVAFKDCIFEEIKLPKALVSIGNLAFQNCVRLKSIILPDSLSNLGFNVFRYCYSMEEVTIPKRIKEIHEDIFELCYSLRLINYKGSKKNWDKIKFIPTKGKYYALSERGNTLTMRSNVFSIEDNEYINVIK